MKSIAIKYSYTAEAEPGAIEWNDRRFDDWPAPSMEVIPLRGDTIAFGHDSPHFEVIHRDFTWLEEGRLQVELLLDVPGPRKKSTVGT